MDLYKFILNPSEFSDVFLQDGDYIVVKTQGGVVDVKGEVKRPGKFEINEYDKLADIIKIAGGFSVYANKESINIKRIVGNKWVFERYKLNTPEYNNLIIGNGDQIKVLKISSIVYGLVKITGAINVEGEYPFKEGMKVNDLIKLAGNLNNHSYLEHAQLIRTNNDLSLSSRTIDIKEAVNNPNSNANLVLKENDSIIIFDKTKLNFENQVTARGALRKTGTTLFAEGLTIKDVILKFGGFKMEADFDKIEVERVLYAKKDSNNSYIQIINLSFPKDQDFLLAPNDIVNFRSLPRFVGQKSVVITGEVKHPGKYTLNGSNEKITEVIQRAGGITSWAFLEGAQLKRNQDSLGLILMNLNHALKNPKSKYNYYLNPGDSISIPKSSNIVSISGAIGYKNVNPNNNTISSPYNRNHRAGYYVKKYGGGYSKEAKKRSVYVVGSNGIVKESKFYGLLRPKVKSGDKIIVQSKIKRTEREKGKKVDWNSVIENVTIKATAILTLLVLTQQAFN